MNEEYFKLRLGEIYATFGKAWPRDLVTGQIFRRVCELPDRFMDYCLERCGNLEVLPANLGRYLFCELWPDYLDAHPELREIRYEQSGCPNCKHDSPGRRLVYEPDGKAHLVACTCCTDRRVIELLGQPTDEQVWDMGWSFTNPLADLDTETSRRLKQIVAGAIRAANEPVCEGHAEMLRQMEEAS